MPKSNQQHWNQPIPFEQNIDENPYPTVALPITIRKAVIDYQKYGQQPISMVASSAIANLSLACQALANVARDRLLVSPVSLYFLTSSLSGERKTACDNIFGRAIRAWEKKSCQELEPLVKDAKIRYQAWEVEKNGLLSRIKRSNTLEDDIYFLQERLSELELSEPEVPLAPMMSFEDVSAEGLVKHLATSWPSSSLWSDEAGTVVGGQAMNINATKFVALLNRLWDNKAYAMQRKIASSFVLANRRLTISLMMQPLILEQMLAKNHGVIRQSGFLPRCLISSPKSTMGERLYAEPPTSMPNLEKYDNYITQCLEHSLYLTKKGCINLPTINMSKSAKRHWINFFNNIEQGLSKNGQWSSVVDFASKAAENTARLAALFSLFEGKIDNISCENIEQAGEIIIWHLNQAKNLVGCTPTKQSTIDAKKIITWLNKSGKIEVTPRILSQLGPVRNKSQRDAAIDELVERNYLNPLKKGNSLLLKLNPLSINDATFATLATPINNQ